MYVAAIFLVSISSLRICAVATPEYHEIATASRNSGAEVEQCSEVDDTSLLQVDISKNSGSIARFEGAPLDGNVQTLGRAQPFDWLFGYEDSTSCSKYVAAAWDNTADSFQSRAFLPVFLFVIAGFVLASGTVKTPEIQANIIIANRPRERRCELDYARIICVACVVIEHSGGKHWTQHNVMFVLQWVLPYLYLTSGIAFMMSQKTMLGFNLRLAIVLVMGIAANWAADLLTGRDWQHDFGNTVFQMFYVVMLIVMSFAASPLRHVLQYPQKQASIALWAPVVIYGTITAVALVYFIIGRPILLAEGSSTWLTNAAPVLNHAPIALIQIGGIIFLCHLACFHQANDILAWVLLAYIYIPRFLIPWPQVGFVHNLELFVFAMVAEAWKIRGSTTIQRLLQSYWPMLLFVMMLASIPDYYGRCDLSPPNTTWERVRFYSIEGILVLCLSAGGV
mmetsp:Transcript_114776/g.180739  ORF Transcript_114776/g.180739 Transcript_114776/m.180739 type:complete len:451 (+) Transcript_114776:78-1430(+)